jgi:outer membrane protein
MRNLRYRFLSFGILIACAISMVAVAQTFPPQQNSQMVETQNYSTNPNFPANPKDLMDNQTIRIGIVNTKKCLEGSKLGKQEQVNFEKMKQQMESVLQDKERALEEVESKLNDDDYMDSVSDEVANELKRKKRSIRNEGMQLQSQYMQTLQQANVKIVQRLTDVISRASAQVAQDTSTGQPLDIIFTDEACTFYSPRLDVSDRVIVKMNAIFDAEQKKENTVPTLPH